MKTNLLNIKSYSPDNFLDEIKKKISITTDLDLALTLNVEPTIISNIRHRKIPIGASFLIRAHELTNMSFRRLRSLMGDFRKSFFD